MVTITKGDVYTLVSELHAIDINHESVAQLFKTMLDLKNEIENEATEIARKHAQYTIDGNPVIVGGELIIKNQDQYVSDIQELFMQKVGVGVQLIKRKYIDVDTTDMILDKFIKKKYKLFK